MVAPISLPGGFRICSKNAINFFNVNEKNWKGSSRSSGETFSRQFLFENIIQDRFNQEGYKAYSNLQQLLLLAARGEECSKIISKLADLYGDKNISGDGDLNKDRLFVQCASFQEEFTDSSKPPDLNDIIKAVQSMSTTKQAFYSEIVVIVKLMLVMPASNAVSERSFSSLKRVKTYLRNRMTEQRLNHLMLLHAHQDLTDALDINAVLDDFIATKDGRKLYFNK